jgi:hypothetical protein
MAAPMSETAGYSFTPKQSKITSALEGLSPFTPVVTQNDFTRDVAGAYAIGDENPEAPATAAYGALQALGAAGLQAYMSNVEQERAVAAEERKHSRALDIEQIKSARSSDAVQKRIQYLRESAAQRLQEVGANKKPPRRMIGEPSTAPYRGGGDIEDEESFDGTDPLEPNLNEDLRDIPPVEPDLPTKDEEDLPAVQGEGSLFNLTPPPVLPVGSDVIPAGAMRINPEQAAQFAAAQAGGAPQALPASAMGLPLTDLAGQINIAYIPSETARQMQELQQGVRDLTPSTAGAPLAQMAPPTTEFPAGFEPGAYANYDQARRVAEMPMPENYERPEVVPRVDDPTGETYFEVMPPKPKAPQTEAERLALEKARLEVGKARAEAEKPATTAGADTDAEQKLRKEFIASSKDYMVVQNAWANIKSASRMAESGGEGAGDLAMIFSFMKLLDPGSVVREQEFANAQNAAGVPDRIRAEYNRLLTGGRLAPDQRKNFVKQGKSLFMERQRGQNQLTNIYKRLAEQSGARPEMVAIDLKTPDPLGDIESQVRAKVVEMTGLTKGTDEYNAKFDELKKLLAQKKVLEAEMESAIAVD